MILMAIWPPQMASEAISKHLIYNFFSCMGERGGGRGGDMHTFTTTGLLAPHINFRPWYRENISISPNAAVRAAV